MQYLANRIGDILEFKDAVESKGIYAETGETYVDRVSAIYINFNADMTILNIELWMDHYAEMPGRGHVEPHRIIRVIEEGSGAGAVLVPTASPLAIGSAVNYEDEISNKKFTRLDKIKSASYSFSKDGGDWSYVMAEGGYTMGIDEFKIFNG